MQVLPVFLLVTLGAVGSLAQPPVRLDVPSSPSASELRRTELRAALTLPLGGNDTRKSQVADQSTDKYYLTEQERADLRQQLRQHLISIGPEEP